MAMQLCYDAQRERERGMEMEMVMVMVMVMVKADERKNERMNEEEKFV